MRTIKHILFAAAFPALLSLASCSTESPAPEDTVDPLMTRGVINVTVSGTSVEATDAIRTARFIVFNDPDGTPTAEVNQFYDMNSLPWGGGSATAAEAKAMLEVSRKPGDSDAGNPKLIVVIVNEPRSTKDALEGVETPADLENIKLEMEKGTFSDDHQSLDGVMMPMSGAVWTDVVYKTETQAGTDANRVPIELDRAVAKVEVYMNTEIEDGITLTAGSGIKLQRTYDESWFVRNEYEGEDGDDETLGNIQTVPLAELNDEDNTRTWTLAGTREVEDTSVSKDKLELLCSFYTPERTCATLAERLALDVKVLASGGIDRTGNFVLKEATNEELGKKEITVVKRNNVYRVYITVGIQDLSAKVMEWNKVEIANPIPSQYMLDVDRDVLTFPYNGETPQIVKVTWNHPAKWDVDNRVTVTNWSALGMNIDADQTALGTADAPQSGIITVTAAARTDNAPETREGFFYVESGNLKKKKIIVRQLGATLAFEVNPDVLHFPYNGDTKTVDVTSNYTSAWTVAGSGTDHSSFSYPSNPGVAGNGTFNVTTVKRALNDAQRKLTATLTVAVNTPAPGDSETVTVDQMYAWLKRGPLSNIPCVETIPAVYISAAGGSDYFLEAITNMPGWNVRMYVTDVNGNKLTQPSTGFGFGTQVNGPITRPASAANDAATYRANGIVIPANNGPASRYISFFLYCAEYPGVEVYAFTGEQPRAVKHGDFAGSNVYWSDEKGSLTFDGADDRSRERYQGVYFRYGSLVGISPSPTGGLTESPYVFIPKYNSGNNPEWYDTDTYRVNSPEAHASGSDSGAWPVNSGWAYFYNQGWEPGIPGPGSIWNDKRGDICIYLGKIGKAPKGYRMPEAHEIFNGNTDPSSNMHQTWSDYVSGYAPWANGKKDNSSWTAYQSVNADGTTPIIYGAKLKSKETGETETIRGGAFLPASGFRNNGGAIGTGTDAPGLRGVYMTRDLNPVGIGPQFYPVKQLDFSVNNGYPASIVFNGAFLMRRAAAPVRCIRDTTLDD